MSYLSKISVILAMIALVVFMIPASFAGTEPSSKAGTKESADKSVGVSLDLGNGYIVYNGQTIAAPSTEIVVPEGSDVNFSANADAGYILEGVVMSAPGGSPKHLSPSNGLYAIGSKSVKKGLSIKLNTIKEATEIVDTTQSVTAATEEESSIDQIIGSGTDTVNTDSAQENDQDTNTADEQGEEVVVDETAVIDETQDGEVVEETLEEIVAEDETKPAPKSLYTYEDSSVAVTAILQNKDAIPGGAEFKVTPVTKGTSGYNYDAYMAALNNNLAIENLTYNDQNTLLYDIAFIVDGKEYEPESGSVTIDITFKKDQLSNELDVTSEDASDVQIAHLSIPEGKLEAAGTTQAATNISAGEIKVQEIPDSAKAVEVSGSAQSAEFKVSSFSVFSVSSASMMAAAAQEGAGELTVSVSFKDAEGNLMTSAPSLDGKYLYAYIENPNNVNQAYNLLLKDNGSGVYTGSTDKLRQGYYLDIPLKRDIDYKVTLCTVGSEVGADGNATTVWGADILSNDSMLGSYSLELPNQPTVSTSSPLDVFARPVEPLPLITFALSFEDSDGAQVVPMPSLGEGTYLYVTLTDASIPHDPTPSRIAVKMSDDAQKKYTASVTYLLDKDGNQVPMNKATSYNVAFFTTTQDLGESTYNYDQAQNKQVVGVGDTIADSYYLTISAPVIKGLDSVTAIAKPKQFETVPPFEIKLDFFNYDGTPVATVPSLGQKTYYYAYVKDPYSSAGCLVPFIKGEKGYTAQIDKLCGDDGKTFYVPLKEGVDYQVTICSVIADNLPYDTPQYALYKIEPYKVVKTGSVIDSFYEVTIPDPSTISAGESYEIRAVGFGPAGNDNFASVLGSCVNFGIVTKDFVLESGDAETNIAAVKAKCATQTGNDLTNKVEQTFIFAHVDGTFGIKGEPAYVRVPSDDADKIINKGTTIYKDTSTSADDLEKEVLAMYNQGVSSSSSLEDRKVNAAVVELSSNKYEINIKNRGAGTYYVNIDNATWNKIMGGADNLNIIKDDNQTIVFNVKAAGDLSMQKYSINGVGADSYLGGYRDDGNGNQVSLGSTNPSITQSIIWNFADASSVHIKGSVTGVLVAPKSTVTVDATSSGWLIADKVIIKAGEWHNVHNSVQKLRDSIYLKAGKLVDGTLAYGSDFRFKLEELKADGIYTTIQDNVKNNNYEISFAEINYGDSFTPDPGSEDTQTHIYRISEADSAGYTPLESSYYAKVAVTQTSMLDDRNNIVIVTKASAPQYFKDAECTVPVESTTPIFKNESEQQARESAEISLTKKLSTGDDPAENAYEFVLKSEDGKVIQTKKNDGAGEVRFDSDRLTYTSGMLKENNTAQNGVYTKTYNYTIHESSEPASGWVNGDDIAVMVVASYDESANVVTVSVRYGERESATETSPDFVNTYIYNAFGSLTLGGQKSIENRTSQSLAGYEFEITGDGLAEPLIVTSDEDGKYSASIDYTLADMVENGEAKDTVTKTYTVKELGHDPARGGIVYDTKSYSISARLHDDGQGKIVVTTTTPKDDQEVAIDTATLNFDNTYSAAGSLTFAGEKSIENRTNQSLANYKFVISEVGTSKTWTMESNAEGKFSKTIEYSLADMVRVNGDVQDTIKNYMITEIKDSSAPNDIIYDTKVYNVEVLLHDNGQGGIDATANTATKDNPEDLKFSNTFITGNVVLKGVKNIENRYFIPGDKFIFTLTPNGDAPMPNVENSNSDEGDLHDEDSNQANSLSVVVEPTGGYSWDFEFPAIVFGESDQGRTYTYTISESKDDNGFPGVALADDQIVSIVVGQAGSDGIIPVTVEQNGAEISKVAFTNVFDAVGGINFNGTKTMSGRDLFKDETYSFSIYEQPLNSQNEPDGNRNKIGSWSSDKNAGNTTADINFTSGDGYAISYGLEDCGRHVYIIEEDHDGADFVNGEFVKNGVTYDRASYEVTVEVTADYEKGVIEAPITSVKKNGAPVDFSNGLSLDFTNSYAGEVSIAFGGTKGMAGDRDSLIGSDIYSFAIYDDDNPDTPIAIASNADSQTGVVSSSFAFDPITYRVNPELDQTGTHNYTIKELGIAQGEHPGVTADTREYKMSVDVAFENKALVAKAKIFYQDGDSVEYVLGDANTFVDLGANFGGIVFTNDFRYDKARMSIDPRKTIYNQNTMTYVALGERKFTFTLTPVDGAPLPYVNNEAVDEVQNDKDGSIHFPEIVFDRPGTYKYTISEKGPNTVDNGMVFDLATVNVSIEVAYDEATGKLNAKTPVYTYVAPQNPIQRASAPELADRTFVNDYKAKETSATLYVSKELSGRDWTTDDSFSFTLEGVSAEDVVGGETVSFAVPMPDGNGKVATATARMTPAEFGSITFDRAGVYTYNITETVPAGVNAENPMLNGIAYDLSTQTATITVKDDNQGALYVDSISYTNPVTVEEGDAAVTTALFKNAYSSTGTSFALSVGKTVNGAEPAAGQFSFVLKGVSENTLPAFDESANAEQADVIATAANDAKGKVIFPTLVYDTAGTYEYTIAEVAGSEPGVIYDTTPHTVVVTVEDNGAGQLVASAAYDAAEDGTGSDALTIDNGYFLANAQLGLTKYYFGNSPQAFSFTLTATDDTWTPRAGTSESDENASGTQQGIIIDDGSAPLALTAQNALPFATDGSASVMFDTISYLQPRSYHYLLAEQGADGYITDSVSYRVTVDVADDMTANVSYVQVFGASETPLAAGETPTFYNNNAITLSFMSLRAMGYASSGSSSTMVYPTVQKTLDGTTAGLNAGDYTFLLTDENGAVVATAVNDSAGRVSFFEQGSRGLRFTKDDEGTHRYTITEVNGGATIDGVTYDDKTIDLVVDVRSTADGLAATCTYSVNGATVTNPTFDNRTEGVNLRLQKVSRAGGEGLENCTYALWMLNPAGADVLIDEAVTDADGWMTFENVPLQVGSLYYFKEVEAPEGHKVDPYRSVYLTPVYDQASGQLALEVAESTNDNLHPNEG